MQYWYCPDCDKGIADGSRHICRNTDPKPIFKVSDVVIESAPIGFGDDDPDAPPGMRRVCYDSRGNVVPWRVRVHANG